MELKKASNWSLKMIIKDPFINYRFHIEIKGLETLAFSKMSQLENETEVEPYQEGGVNDYTHKFPKATSYTNITLEHGLGLDDLIYDWREKVIEGDMLKALKNGTIKLYDKDKIIDMWHFQGAWPVKLTIAELDASSSGAVLIESVELSIERFERVKK